MDSGVGIAANLLVQAVQEKICSVRKAQYESKYQYVTEKYYRSHVRNITIWNWIRRLFGIKPLCITDSETYCEKFNARGLSITAMIEYMCVGAEYAVELKTLEEVAALVDAGVRNNTKVYLSPEQCHVLGFGHNIIPRTVREQEYAQAEIELNAYL